jgi:uncharacterized secreted protein with C-terminal beta-propeller domain
VRQRQVERPEDPRAASDPSRPRRLHQVAVTDSSSQAAFDHRAFLWSAPRDLAVVPLSVWDGGFFQGAAWFRVRRADGIAQVGVPHTTTPPVARSFVVRGRLFTLSEAGLEANALDTLAEEAWLAFPAS